MKEAEALTNTPRATLKLHITQLMKEGFIIAWAREEGLGTLNQRRKAKKFHI